MYVKRKTNNKLDYEQIEKQATYDTIFKTLNTINTFHHVKNIQTTRFEVKVRNNVFTITTVEAENLKTGDKHAAYCSNM